MDMVICKVADIANSGRKVIDVSGLEIAIFRLEGELFAYENRCPHAGGPACQGRILPLTLEAVDDRKRSSGRVFSKNQTNVVCPWHGMEFNIRSGEHTLLKHLRLRKVPIRIDDEDIVITVNANTPGLKTATYSQLR